MVSWGADIVFGGHPHVVEPAEVVNKDGSNKLIIYSMGNFPSNQRLETMGMWRLPNGQSEGSWWMWPLKRLAARQRSRQLLLIQPGSVGLEGHPILLKVNELHKYQTHIFGKILSRGGKYRDKLDEETKESGHGLPRNGRNMFTWTGLRVERNRAWKEWWTGSPLGILGIDRGDLGNQIFGHPPQAKAEEGLMEPFFRKKDTEESLIDSLALSG